MNHYTEAIEQADDIDLRALVIAMWSKRTWMAVCVLICIIPFAALAFLSTPIYRTSTVLIAAGGERSGLTGMLSGALGSLGGLASFAGLNPGMNNAETEEALAVLKSREFTEGFINDKQLMPQLFAKQWDSQRGTWLPGSKPPTLAQAYKYFNGHIRSVLQDKKTGLITMEIEWRDREQAASWANDLVARLNAEMRSRAIAKADAAVGYLQKELPTTADVATREAINRLIEAQVRQRMLANVTREYAFRVVDKALPPDRNDVVWPRKLILLAAGPVVGIMVGMLGVLLHGWWTANRSAPKR